MTTGIVLDQEAIETIAEACHEANRVLQARNQEMVNPRWVEAPEEMRDSVIDGVLYLLGNPEATPQESHANWLAFKEREGWSYGEVKSFRYKTHPCFVPYEQLPRDQRVKDALFHGIVRSLTYGMRP